MKQLILITFFFFAWQVGFCQPECFRNNDTNLLSQKSRIFLRDIHTFYQEVPDKAVHILPLHYFINNEPQPDTSSHELELLVYQSNVRIRALFIDYFGFTHKDKVFSYLQCAGNDTTQVAYFDGCLGHTTSFAEYAYSNLKQWLTPEQRSELQLKWLENSSDQSLRYTLLTELVGTKNFREQLLKLIAINPQEDIYQKLMAHGDLRDRELLIEFAKKDPKNAHDLMWRYPHNCYIPYVKMEIKKAPESPLTSDLLLISEAIDTSFADEIYATVCQKLDSLKDYPFGQQIYNSSYYFRLDDTEKKELILKLLPSLEYIDSLDIDYLSMHHREAFDVAVSLRLLNSISNKKEAYTSYSTHRVFNKYTEKWTNEKQKVCRQLCEKSQDEMAVLATIALIEHHDPQTSELLLRHFQMDTTNPEGYRMRHFYSIDAMTFSNDSILFQKVGAILLQQFLKDELHTDAFNYLYILDRSKIPGFYEILLNDLEKGPTAHKHPVIASFLLTKNNSTINKRLVAIYQSFLNQPEVEYYNTEIGFYLTEYGLL